VNRTSLNGVTGFPSKASKAAGEELFTWMVEDLCELIERGMHEQPPLPHSYFDRIDADAE
jgi:creatinine amidohydrolase